MNPETLRAIIIRLLGTLIRHGLFGLGVWLESHGVGTLDDGTQTNLFNLIIGALCMLAPVVWSYLRSHFASKEITELSALADRFGLRKADASSYKPPTVPPAALFLLMGAFSASIVGCATIVSFDQNSLDSAKRLKFQSLQLIAHATEKADLFQDQIKALQNDLDTEIAYEKGKGSKNIVSEKQWETLASPDHLLGRFLKDWSGGKQFSQSFIDEDSKIIGDVFDSIVELEAAKSK